jgi:uncharacterized protein
MAENKKPEELMYHDERFTLPKNFDAGKVRSIFFTELRDSKKIWGTRCPSCKRVACPPHYFCGQCNVLMTEWIDQGTEGTLEYFDVNYYEAISPRTGKIRPVPWARGVVRMDGGGALIHFLHPADNEAHKLGDRYRAVIKEEGRTGNVFDMLHWERCEDQTPPEFEVKVCEAPSFKENVTSYGVLEGATQKTMGAIASKFYAVLRDDRKIMATRCNQCNKTYMPPESICPECSGKLDEWVEISGKGMVKSFTVINYGEPAQPYPPPFAYALIQMDGADTAMLHVLGEVDLANLKTGLRVEPVFRKRTEGNILDIKYFRPAKG